MENDDTLDIRYLKESDQLLIFYNCNYGGYYGCLSDDGHYVIYRNMEDDKIVGIEIFNFKKIIESKDKITDIIVEYDKNIDTLSILKDNKKIMGVDIHKFKEKIKEF